MKRSVKKSAENAAFKFVKKTFSKAPFMSVIVAAGGTSSRMGGINKLFAEISGVPVLAITLSVLNSSKYVSEIILVANESDMLKAAELCERYSFSKVKKIIKGGTSRAESVWAGMNEVSDSAELIAIHDGARPFVTEEVIKKAVEGAIKYGAAASAVPVKDTIKKAANSFVSSTPDRSELFAVQTPQVFDAGLIKAALYKAITEKASITDDCSAVENIGGTVKLTEGDYDNIKITTVGDLAVAEAIFNSEERK